MPDTHRHANLMERASHDAPIHGQQGLMLQLQALADGMAPHDPARANLAQALVDLGRDFARGRRRLGFRLVMGGEPRGLRPEAQAAAVQLAREALCNAVSHANAQRVGVELQFGVHALGLRVRDDGRGFSTRQGDGIPGTGWARMRDCAQRSGGVVQVWSRPGRGTEVALEIPAGQAYETRPAAGWQAALRRALGALS